MLAHAFAEGAPPAAAVLPLVLLQAAAVSKRAALSTAGMVARRMPTERGSGMGKPPVGSNRILLTDQ
jgi:hypothetical protein